MLHAPLVWYSQAGNAQVTSSSLILLAPSASPPLLAVEKPSFETDSALFCAWAISGLAQRADGLAYEEAYDVATGISYHRATLVVNIVGTILKLVSVPHSLCDKKWFGHVTKASAPLKLGGLLLLLAVMASFVVSV